MSDYILMRQMCEEVKKGLVNILLECKKINNGLEAEFIKNEDKKRYGKCENRDLTITSEGWKTLVDNIKEEKNVLDDITTSYRDLFSMDGCGCLKRVEDNECSRDTQYDFKSYDDLKEHLHRLLKTSRKLCRSIKEELDQLKVQKDFNEFKKQTGCAQQPIQPEMIKKLTNDIAEQFDSILKNCEKLWRVKERDSGYSSRISQDFAESLSINSVDSNLMENMAQSVIRRRPSAVEHDEIEEQTNLKELLS